jgi:hypothetical protein
MKASLILRKDEIDKFWENNYEDGPSLFSMPFPKKHKRAIISMLTKFDALKKGRKYSAVFSDRLDSVCYDYIDHNNLWAIGLREELFEAYGKDIFAWIAIDDGNYYFLGDVSSFKSPYWDVVEEGRHVIVEKVGVIKSNEGRAITRRQFMDALFNDARL